MNIILISELLALLSKKYEEKVAFLERLGFIHKYETKYVNGSAVCIREHFWSSNKQIIKFNLTEKELIDHNKTVREENEASKNIAILTRTEYIEHRKEFPIENHFISYNLPRSIFSKELARQITDLGFEIIDISNLKNVEDFKNIGINLEELPSTQSRYPSLYLYGNDGILCESLINDTILVSVFNLKRIP